jgi:hypothetical protein
MTLLLKGFVHLCVWQVLGALWVFATARLARPCSIIAWVLCWIRLDGHVKESAFALKQH